MALHSYPVRLKGYPELMRALSLADKETKKLVRARLRKAAQPIRDDVERRFAGTNDKSARGYRVVVRARAISVEQRYRKTTGKRSDYTVLQATTALDPAFDHGIDGVVVEVGKALDDIADIFYSHGRV